MLLRIGTILWLWLACACAFAAVPERPRFRIVGAEQGLPSTDIKALARDRDGYLWIATADGLARYDGVGIRVWQHQPGNLQGLPGNNVQALMVDAGNRVWAATEGGGISVLDAQRQAFVHYRKATHPQMGSDDVWAFANQGDTVWFGTYDGGLHRMDAQGRIRRYTAKRDGLPSDTVLALAVQADGSVWIGTDHGLARMRDGRIEGVRLTGTDEVPLVFSLTQQADGLWVGTSAGVWRLDAQGKWSQPAWSPMFHRPNAMNVIVRDGDGGLWIASQRGLWRQAGDEPPVPVRLAGPDMPRGINALLLDPEGGLWVPVAGLGLGYLRADWRQLAQYAGAADGLQGAMYRALAPSRDGGFLLGGFNGMVEQLSADGSLRTLDEDGIARLRGIKVLSIAEDRGGRLWLGHRNGLIRVGSDGAIDEWRVGDGLDATPRGQIDQLQVTADGSLWLSAPGGGVQQRDPASGHVLRDIPADAAHGLATGDIEALALSPHGEVWVAGADGMAMLDAVGNEFHPLPEFGAERVYALAFDGDATLWLQRQSGLVQYRRDGGAWRIGEQADTAHGVPAVGASGVQVDRHHRVWLSTSRGLYRYDPANRNLRRHGVRDGTTSQEYLDRALAMSTQGVLAAATADGGIVLVDTNAADPVSSRPSLRFDQLSVRRNGEWRDMPMPVGLLRLASGEREFRIRARLLAYADPESNRYWSKLDGFDHDWVALGANGERVFTGLAPGRYTLRIRARDAAGNAAKEQQLVFDVPPPWWRSWWAMGLYALLALLAMLAAAASYRARLKRRHAMQLNEEKRALAEQASDAKSRFLATLGHEVRTPMTGVLGMSELLRGSRLDEKQRSQVDAIHRAGEHLLRLVNDALDLARIEAGKLELANADFALRPLLDEVAGLMAPVAERKGLAFLDAMAGDVPAAVHGDRTRIQQILLNLLGNAIKFTETGHVALETTALSPQGVRFKVTDSGPGLSIEQQSRLFRRFEQAEGARTASRYGGSGLGLAISQELAAAMGGRIAVGSEPGRGTRFIVELPLASTGTVPQATSPAPLADSGALHLLLVEDDPIVVEVMLELLREQGHAVVHAAHGLAALSEAATRRFDAALLDLDLPGLDGLALARMLRAQGFAAPLLAVTARSDAEAETQARAAGFDDFLRKPVSGAVLAQALGAALR
ncbi:hybrid sensor histidine kinase/response regulator [Thermomonas sp. HDW16]|uniref:hybrid sensor histidine kinase/response regulator n=1 Tax=Thermomonas sp. HDW16 TaxID=2714945 RepID=UPI001F108623|nr:hybrid sensor histidine kinase/response regulator [Thermomonas sp. HDW16]